MSSKVQVNVRISIAVKKAAQELAANQRRSLSGLIEYLLVVAVEKAEKRNRRQ